MCNGRLCSLTGRVADVARHLRDSSDSASTPSGPIVIGFAGAPEDLRKAFGEIRSTTNNVDTRDHRFMLNSWP